MAEWTIDTVAERFAEANTARRRWRQALDVVLGELVRRFGHS